MGNNNFWHHQFEEINWPGLVCLKTNQNRFCCSLQLKQLRGGWKTGPSTTRRTSPSTLSERGGTHWPWPRRTFSEEEREASSTSVVSRRARSSKCRITAGDRNSRIVWFSSVADRRARQSWSTCPHVTVRTAHVANLAPRADNRNHLSLPSKF